MQKKGNSSPAQDYLRNNFDNVIRLIESGERIETLFRSKELKLGSVATLYALLNANPELATRYQQAIPSANCSTS